MNTCMNENASCLYHELGGAEALQYFVSRLYYYMETLPEVREVHELHAMPLGLAGERLYQFLSGWLGGPPLFHQAHGHPQLRRRHLHIAIGDAERDQWMLCAERAANDMDWSRVPRAEFMLRLREMADHLRNHGPFRSAQCETRECDA